MCTIQISVQLLVHAKGGIAVMYESLFTQYLGNVVCVEACQSASL